MNRSHRSLKTGQLILLIALIAGGIYWWQQHSPESEPSAGVAAQNQKKGKTAEHHTATSALLPVQAATAVKQNVPCYLTGLGTVTAAHTVTVRSRVAGNLIALHFQEGDEVKAGQLLAEIDPRPYQVALMQAQGQLAKDQAILANARRDLARYEKLAKTHLVSDQELDSQRSRVNETLGSIKADEGNIASARLNLTYSQITAPISGRVGLKQVDTGNYITSGDTSGIVIITQTQPIDMIFSLPENQIASVIAALRSGQPPEAEAWDRGNQKLLSSGTLLSMDNQIDATTGTLKMKARFSNQDNSLFPNQFVNARLKISTLQDAIVIPTGALQMSNEGHFVWLVGHENSVSKRRVTIGMQNSKIVVINSGLSAGDRVVTDGIDRLTEDARVEVIPSQNPAVSASKIAQPTQGEHP